ncbi:peptidase M48 [Haematobacter missouriensis]|uniref:Peptidase M48 n=1 Tax=Haematobacter missouriensis TaxID=366616 RepID=A0A212AJM2_9RHOB|nr:M48 family metalloprotease [Haematobacter missouriensis]KFI32786.1 peptidase M48 [Haematobacter missouriensis]OWJ77457.1 peptidase M48 [Haematobacter missouriensis]OWJ81616.1 peptidase M48 [Haematobacter missouriensis]
MARFPLLLLLLAMATGACAPAPRDRIPVPVPPTRTETVPDAQPGARLDARTAAHNFIVVVDRMEPVVEAECRRQQPRRDCDFLIAVDDRPGQPANAFQTLDAEGRPVLAFTLALIADARNQDEIAFIMGHEAGHHILGHLPRAQQQAAAGAMILGTLATLSGADAEGIKQAEGMGASMGARTYSKNYELQADELGTILAYRAGFDPARGAQFFHRIPDPGDRFLGSHPPNSERQRVVMTTLRKLQTGQLR